MGRAARLAASRPAWQTRINNLQPALAALRRLAADRPALNLGQWPITCLGHPADTGAEADRTLRSAPHAIPAVTTGRAPREEAIEPQQIGTLGPWPVLALRDWSTVTITIDATTYGLRFQLSIAVEDLARTSDTRIWQRIINRPFRGIATAIQDHQDELRRLQSNLTQADQDAGAPFPHQHDLDDRRTRLAEVEEQLMPAKLPEPTAPPAPEVEARQL